MRSYRIELVLLASLASTTLVQGCGASQGQGSKLSDVEVPIEEEIVILPEEPDVERVVMTSQGPRVRVPSPYGKITDASTFDPKRVLRVIDETIKAGSFDMADSPHTLTGHSAPNPCEVVQKIVLSNDAMGKPRASLKTAFYGACLDHNGQPVKPSFDENPREYELQLERVSWETNKYGFSGVKIYNGFRKGNREDTIFTISISDHRHQFAGPVAPAQIVIEESPELEAATDHVILGGNDYSRLLTYFSVDASLPQGCHWVLYRDYYRKPSVRTRGRINNGFWNNGKGRGLGLPYEQCVY